MCSVNEIKTLNHVLADYIVNIFHCIKGELNYSIFSLYFWPYSYQTLNRRANDFELQRRNLDCATVPKSHLSRGFLSFFLKSVLAFCYCKSGSWIYNTLTML